MPLLSRNTQPLLSTVRGKRHAKATVESEGDTQQPSTSVEVDSPTDSDDNGIFGEMGGVRKKQKRATGYGNRNQSPFVNFHNPRTAPEAAKTSASGKFQRPRQVIDSQPLTQTGTAFRTPQKCVEGDSKPPLVSKFKAPLSMPTSSGPSNDGLNRTTRRSARVAKLNSSADTTTSKGFKAIPSLKKPGLQNLANSLSLPDDADRAKHSSQVGSDHIDFDAVTDHGDTHILSGDEEDQDVYSCPYCHDTISDPSTIEKVKRVSKLNMAKQAAFCRSHRQAEAQRQWNERGYPDIDWDLLPSRVSQLHKHVLRVIHGSHSSLFRFRLEERFAAGADRSMLQTLAKNDGSFNTLTPGYYGGRGAKLISSQLMSAFSSEIRKCAGSDKVIGAAGASGFVQAVLVPEVAVRLIMEDLGVDTIQAELVLEESAEVGYLLWEADEEDTAAGSEEF